MRKLKLKTKFERFSVRSMCTVRDTAHYLLEDIYIVSTEPRRLSERFLIDLATEVAGSEEESSEKPSK